jgi:hypothetical protein
MDVRVMQLSKLLFCPFEDKIFSLSLYSYTLAVHVFSVKVELPMHICIKQHVKLHVILYVLIFSSVEAGHLNNVINTRRIHKISSVCKYCRCSAAVTIVRMRAECVGPLGRHGRHLQTIEPRLRIVLCVYNVQENREARRM